MSSYHQEQIEILETRLTNLTADYQAANRQLDSELDAVNRNRLKRRCEALEQEISQVESKLASWQSENEAKEPGDKAPPPMPSTPPTDDFSYDVFISYRQQEPDKTWVRKTLCPRLEAAGLRVCIDYRDFRLGAPLILEMARAVEQSRYTLAILSPTYLTNNFTELENVLADHLGRERSQYRLLATMREPCEPRLGIRIQAPINLTDDEFEDNINHLVQQLRQQPKK